MRSWVRYAKWLVIAGLLAGANVFFYSSGYDSGLTKGAHVGITAALSDVAKRGFGEWVVIGANNDGLPDTKFRFFDSPASNLCPDQMQIEMPSRSILKQSQRTDDST